jgi:hypothetical protein
VSDYIPSFISNLYDQLDNPDDYTFARLSGWFLDASNIGQLNNLIGSDYSPTGFVNSSGKITGYAIVPEIGLNELGIYKLLFNYKYYNSLARTSLASSSTAAGDWVTLEEGDSKITRLNKNEISKTYRGLAQDAKQELDKAVKMYLKYGAISQQIAGDDTVGFSNYIQKDYNRQDYGSWPAY